MEIPLLEFTDKGTYCRETHAYANAPKSVCKALISCGHSNLKEMIP